jgi:hypothetical protein
MATRQPKQKDPNRDPLTGEAGSHPVGAGLGAAMGGAAAGMAAGAVGGPIGAAVGAIAGGVAGGYAGKAAAEALDPTAEEAYWQEHYTGRPYIEEETPYETYAPAYQYGWESRARFPDRSYEEIESDLRREWWESERNRKLEWERAQPAVRDAWDRIETRRREDLQE